MGDIQTIVIEPVEISERGPIAELYQIDGVIRELNRYLRMYCEWRTETLQDALDSGSDEEGEYRLVCQAYPARRINSVAFTLDHPGLFVEMATVPIWEVEARIGARATEKYVELDGECREYYVEKRRPAFLPPNLRNRGEGSS